MTWSIKEGYLATAFQGHTIGTDMLGNTTRLTAKFSLYVSPYLIANQGGRYTKHIYIGSQRVVSKIGDFDSYGSDPRRIQYAGSETDGLSVDYKVKYRRIWRCVVTHLLLRRDVPDATSGRNFGNTKDA